MGIKKLSDAGLGFVISCRDDPNNTYTWKDIADMVKDKFGVELTWQAISERYRIHKKKTVGVGQNIAQPLPQDQNSNTMPITENVVSVQQNAVPKVQPEPQTKIDQKADEEAEARRQMISGIGIEERLRRQREKADAERKAELANKKSQRQSLLKPTEIEIDDDYFNKVFAPRTEQ